MEKTLAELIAPQVTESDATMVDVYGLKSQSADNMAGVHTVLAGLGMIPAVGNVADAVDTMLYLAEGDVGGAGLSALSAIPLAGLFAGGLKTAKGARKAAKLTSESDLYKAKGIHRGGKQRFIRGESDFLDPKDYMSKRARKAANKAEAKEMKKMQEEIAKDPKGYERKMQKEMEADQRAMERERLIREEEEFFEHGREGFEGSDYEVNFPDPYEGGF